MSLTLEEASALTLGQLKRLPKKELGRLRDQVAVWRIEDAKRHWLEYYSPVNPQARRVHLATSREVAVQGGNKSGKTATMLAEAAIQLTKIVPKSLPDYPRVKLRPGPIRVRLVVTSLTSAWDINLKPKLQWWEWSGRPNGDDLLGDPDRGHWGFIPPHCLLNGDWATSWSERHRVLTLVDGSTLQVMSHDQAIQDFNQGAFDLVIEDEIPPEDVHRANRLRVMERGGQIYTGGTPSDDRTAAVTSAWFFDQLLAPGLERDDPADPEIFAVALWTEHNRTLDQANVDFVAKGLTPEQRRARLHGEAIHLGGLIFPGVQVRPAIWCFRCDAKTRLEAGQCVEERGTDVTGYSHVWDEGDLPEVPKPWPILFVMDPHQARETACLWAAVDPQDGWWVLAELEVGGDALLVKRTVEALESERGWTVLQRIGDPKITTQTNQFAREFNGEAFTIRRAFEDVGFFFDDANTNFTVARDRLLQALRPNPYTRAPQLRIHASCKKTLYQLGHFTWDDRSRRENVSTKEKPSRTHSDFPACLRYLAMLEPTFAGCQRLRFPERLSLVSGVGRSLVGW